MSRITKKKKKKNSFIQVFRSGKKMLSQAGYTFTHIKSAINFIETLNHQSLNMSEMEFEM